MKFFSDNQTNTIFSIIVTWRFNEKTPRALIIELANYLAESFDLKLEEVTHYVQRAFEKVFLTIEKKDFDEACRRALWNLEDELLSLVRARQKLRPPESISFNGNSLHMLETDFQGHLPGTTPYILDHSERFYPFVEKDGTAGGCFLNKMSDMENGWTLEFFKQLVPLEVLEPEELALIFSTQSYLYETCFTLHGIEDKWWLCISYKCGLGEYHKGDLLIILERLTEDAQKYFGAAIPSGWQIPNLDLQSRTYH